MYSPVLVVFLASQLILLLLDVCEIHRRQRFAKDLEPVRWRTLIFLLIITTLFLGVQLGGSWLAPGPLQILESVRQFLAARTSNNAPQAVSHWQATVLGVLLYYIAGFWDYAVHRCFSHSRWFWCTHEYHHLPRQVTILMPGILVRPFGFIPVTISTLATAATVYYLLLATSLPLWDLRPLLPTLLVIGLVLTASHSLFLRRWLIVHRVMSCLLLTTPQEHLLHHGIDSRANYGNFTTLWDRLLGTYLNPNDVNLDEVPLGLSYDQDFLGTITLGAVRLSSAQRRRYQVARYCNLKEIPDRP